MPISHAKSITVADATGTVTGWFGTSTVTIAASAIQLPSDWNSAHNVAYTLTGNTISNTTVSGTNIIFAGSGGVSVGGSNGSIIISGITGGGGGGATMKGYYNPFMDREFLAAQIGNNQVFVQPMPVSAPFQHNRFIVPVNYSNATNSSFSATLSISVGLYTRNGNSLSLASSSSQTYAVTNSGTVGSYSLVSGMRLMPINWTNTVSQGDWWIAMGSRTTTGGGAGMTFSNFVASQINSALNGFWQSAANASNQFVLGLGSFNTTTTAMPASMAFSAIAGSAAVNARLPIFQFASSTT
jgi:hypothetical protein